MSSFKIIITALFFVGFSHADLLSILLGGNLANYGEKCKASLVPWGGTCTRAEQCPEIFEDIDIKSLGERSKKWVPAMSHYFLKGYFCGYSNDEPFFCCKSPKEVEDLEDVSNHPNVALLDRKNCGPIFQDRIAYGDKAELNEYPWMGLLINKKWNMFEYFCGGTVINERYVLTAAHCVDNQELTHVRLGEDNLETLIDCDRERNKCAPEHQDVPVEKVIIHPTYKYDHSFYNDIALLRLSRPLDFSTDAIRPVCLPVGKSQQSPNLIGKMVDVAGWGKTENGTRHELLKASLRVLDRKECNLFPPTSPYSQICTGKSPKRANTCPGDSGGPLLHYDEVDGSVRSIQYGIVSLGTAKCGEENALSIYTDVGYYMKFILDNMEP